MKGARAGVVDAGKPCLGATMVTTVKKAAAKSGHANKPGTKKPVAGAVAPAHKPGAAAKAPAAAKAFRPVGAMTSIDNSFIKTSGVVRDKNSFAEAHLPDDYSQPLRCTSAQVRSRQWRISPTISSICALVMTSGGATIMPPTSPFGWRS